MLCYKRQDITPVNVVSQTYNISNLRSVCVYWLVLIWEWVDQWPIIKVKGKICWTYLCWYGGFLRYLKYTILLLIFISLNIFSYITKANSSKSIKLKPADLLFQAKIKTPIQYPTVFNIVSYYNIVGYLLFI